MRPVSTQLAVGNVLRTALKGADGAPFNTRTLRGKPALVFFYRGNWCPLCMAQVKEVAARYREIAETGARVLLVSPQPHDNTAGLAKRFDVPFDFLTDEGNRAARASTSR
jgi:peroxiredoxin